MSVWQFPSVLITTLSEQSSVSQSNNGCSSLSNQSFECGGKKMGGKTDRSWTSDGPPMKKNTVMVKSVQQLPVFRTVHVVFRAFRFNTEIMGYAVWNSFQWREHIDQEYGFPANSYMRLEDIAHPDQFPPLIEETEGVTYVNTGAINMNDAASLAHLFLFSAAERTTFRLGNNQPRGFHFVTKRGIANVPLEKWLQHDNNGVLQLDEDELTFEMEDSNARCQAYLQQQCEITQQPDTPGTHMNEAARYVLNKQRRLLTENMLPLFDRVLNCSRGNVSRPVGDVEVQVDVGTV